MGKKKDAKRLAKLQQPIEQRKEPLIKKQGESPVDAQGFFSSPSKASDAPATTTQPSGDQKQDN